MKITKDMLIQNIIEKYPGVVPILFSYGLSCVGCSAAKIETLEQGALVHGIEREELKKLIKDLNKSKK